MYGAHMKFNLHFLHAAERVTPGGGSRARGERINIGAPSNARSDRDSLRQKAETEPRISGNFSDPPALDAPARPTTPAPSIASAYSHRLEAIWAFSLRRSIAGRECFMSTLNRVPAIVGWVVAQGELPNAGALHVT